MNIALILAGGQGARMGSKLPKQFLLLEGKPVIIRSIEAFERHPDIGAICVVCGEPWSGRLKYQIEQAGFRKVCAVIPGGATRRESSFLGLEYLTRHYAGTDIVLIHDAARPLVTQRIISDNIACAARHQACTTVIPAQDTLLESLNQKTAHSVPDRSRFFAVQTPQTFRLDRIYQAHQRLPAKAEVTDDAGILTGQRFQVYLVPGEKTNLKITSPEDLSLAGLYLRLQETKPEEAEHTDESRWR